MANLKETAQWEEGIYQWETTDPVLGGENGIDNKPTRQLANRTVWLKQELEAAQQAQRNRQITAGAGLIGGGKLSADRSIALATPSTLSGSTSNWAGNETVGHTHELAAATATLAGVVKLINTLSSTATDAALSAAQGKALNDAIAYLNNLLVGYTTNSYCPSGMIMTFAGDFAPAGWLKANGAAVSRTAYADLFRAIGTRYGAGDGRSTFNLPDLRGEFARYWDDGRGVDAGRALGSWQSDALQKHTHLIGTSSGENLNNGLPGIDDKYWQMGGGNYAPATGHIALTHDTGSDGYGRVGGRFAGETRPRNIALLACIKI